MTTEALSEPFDHHHDANLKLLMQMGGKLWREAPGVFSVDHDALFTLLNAARSEGHNAQTRAARTPPPIGGEGVDAELDALEKVAKAATQAQRYHVGPKVYARGYGCPLAFVYDIGPSLGQQNEDAEFLATFDAFAVLKLIARARLATPPPEHLVSGGGKPPLTPEEFGRAEELLNDPDVDDCARFTSRYGRALLDFAKAHGDSSVPPSTTGTGGTHSVEDRLTREAIARLIYEANPCGDQETDADGRPTGPGYTIGWNDLAEYDPGILEGLLKTADAILMANSNDDRAREDVAFLTKLAVPTQPPSREGAESGWPKSCDTMRFLGENGYPYELESALNTFTPGALVTVHRCEVGDFSHRLQFREHPDRWWNGVMFELAAPPPTSEEK